MHLTLGDIANDLLDFTLDRKQIIGILSSRPGEDERADRDGGDGTRVLSIELADGEMVRAWMDEALVFGEEEPGAAWLQPSDGSRPLRLWACEEVLAEAGA